MRALIIVDTVVPAGNASVAQVENAMASMGIKTQLMFAGAVNPTVAMINRMDDIDLVVLPFIQSGNFFNLQRFFNGTVTKPVLWGGNLSNTPELKGVESGAQYGGAQKYLAKFSDDNTGYVHNQYWLALNTALVAPAASYPILEATSDLGSGKRLVCAWKYTPDGVNFVYHHREANSRYICWHLLVQEAIKDGKLARPARRAPVFLMQDHINADGSNNVGGTCENPGLIATYGEFFRKIGGICYTNWDRRYAAGGSIADKTTGALANMIKAYLDVYNITACHDHTTNFNYMTEGNSPDDPFTKSRGKPTLDSSYQLNAASMAAYGIPVATDLAHFANNFVPQNWYELGSPDVSVLADPNNASIKAGYGFKFARSGGVNSSWPHMNTNTASIPSRHFLRERVRVRGITLITTSEMDGSSLTPNQTEQTVTDKRYDCTLYMTHALNFGLFGYWHPLAMEDVAWRTANVAGNPTTASDGVSTSTQLMDSLERMWNMARHCPDTIKLGANCLDYVR